MNPLLIAKNLASMTLSVAASAHVSATAGGAGNNVAVDGITIDRENLQSYGSGPTIANAPPIGAIFLLFYDAAITAGKTLSINGVQVQHSPDGTTWSTLWDQSGTASLTEPAGWPAAGVVASATGQGVLAYQADLQGAERYVRFNFTPDLSNTTTDTATLAAVAVLSGTSEVPAGKV